jgi:hypothetical protein
MGGDCERLELPLSTNRHRQSGLERPICARSYQHGEAGKPTKYEPEAIERLLPGLADGLPIKSASITAGIGASTLGDWCEK